MSVRFSNRRILLNQEEEYERFFKRRHISSIRQWSTGRLYYPTVSDLRAITRNQHIWKAGDRYYKLAIQYYGQAQYWWVIALFNKKPTEAHLRVGQSISIPMPLQAILRVYDG